MVENRLWMLDGKQRIDDLVEKLTYFLKPPTRIHWTECNTTWIESGLMKSRYASIPDNIRIVDTQLYIPVGSGIMVNMQPIQFDGRLYPAAIEIDWGALLIRSPYFFYQDKHRVDAKHHLLRHLPSK